MKLLTQELEKQLPPLYQTENIKTEEKIVYIKYFTPDSNWSWYVCEYDKEQKIFFGYVIGFEKEWGYFSLEELQSLRGILGLPVERDISFAPTKFKDLQKEL